MKASHHPITAYYGADHDRLDALFNKYREKKQEDATAAKPYFREFFKGLRRHIVWEEDVLFPFFEKVSGSALGPTQVMRQEHRMIGEILERMHEKVRALDPNTNAEEEALISVLKPHNDKEENILYPAIDQCAGPGEAAELFLKMEEIPEDRLQACCGSH
jgi:regulator of cell morphogenesis and NO signaling